LLILASPDSGLLELPPLAIRLYRNRDDGPSDRMRELNLRTAGDRAALARERRKTPVNLMDGSRQGHVDPTAGDRAALACERRKTPVNLMDGSRQGHVDPKIRAAILDAEVGFLTSTLLVALIGDVPLFLRRTVAPRSPKFGII
jgi:hypothetical protein